MSFQMLEVIMFVERYRIDISIYSNKPTSCFIVNQKITLDKVEQYRAYTQPSLWVYYTQPANFDRRITSYALFINKSVAAETIEFGLAPEICNRHFVIGQAEIA